MWTTGYGSVTLDMDRISLIFWIVRAFTLLQRPCMVVGGVLLSLRFRWSLVSEQQGVRAVGLASLTCNATCRMASAPKSMLRIVRGIAHEISRYRCLVSSLLPG